MQYSDDDINELFRMASRDFRLTLKDEDWDAIQIRLGSNAPALTNLEMKKNNRNHYRLLFIALLVYMIAGTTVFILSNIRNKSTREQRANIFTIYKAVNTKKNNSPTTLNDDPALNESKEVLAHFATQHNKVINDEHSSGEWGIHYPDREKNMEIQPKSFNFLKKPEIDKKGMKISNATEKNIKQDRSVHKDKRFYIGIVTGPQFNNIKEQDFSKPGMSAGVLMGYLINNKLAIETGFFISDKRYFSSGEYFDMTKLSGTMPAGMKLLSVQSKSTVLEIPIKFKYDLLKMNRGSLFGTAGVSSYILTNEYNHYLALLNGSHENLTGNYSKNQKYFAAALNLSAGYEFSTRNGIMLRFEPYLQIPLKEIGVGSLPILSTGLNLGITIPVFK